jgi:phosphoenolpyruvate carboxylase
MTPEEEADNDLALANAILTLWQSRMLRPVRLKVLDEVKNGITYFKETFFTELPRLYIQATQQLQKRYPERTGRCRPSSASAAGSAATATATPSSPPRSCAKPCACNQAAALNHYLEEVHELGGELPLSDLLVKVTPELLALAEHSTDHSPQRRRALPPRPVRHLRPARRHRPQSSITSSRSATKSAAPNPMQRRMPCAPTSRC